MQTPTETALAEFIRYNNWANQKVLAACQELSEEQLEAAMPGTYGSIRSTLKHIITAEVFYLGLLTGRQLEPTFRWSDKPALAEMKAYAAQVGDALLQAVESVPPDERINDQDEGKLLRYQAMAIYIQIINHGVEHRTNITTILSAGKLTAPGVDGWAYLSSHHERFEYEVS